MHELNITLTDVDRIVLESYKEFAKGLSDYLGSSYEIVLHSLEDMDRSVIQILNGFHTGREIGAPITDLALEMLSRINETTDTPYLSYFSKNKNDEPMRSTTIVIKGKRNKIIGLLCINFHMNSSFLDFINPFIPQENSFISSSENFASNALDVIEKAVSKARQRVYSDSGISAGMKNREIVAELHERGIFSLKNSVVRTAEILNISKNTVYMHLRNLNGAEEG